MSIIVKDVVKLVEDLAPINLQESWDNSGSQIGDIMSKVTGITLALDLTDKTLNHAIDKGNNMIITHHPFFFSGIKSIDTREYKGKLIKRLIEEEIYVYAAHTNLDKTKGGVNYVLANILGFNDVKNFSTDEEDLIGVYKSLDKLSLDVLLDRIVSNICPRENIRIYGKIKKDINKIGIIGGAGSSMIDTALLFGCDTLITGDVKHHDGQTAYENNMMLVDLGHFYTELPVLFMLKEFILDTYEHLNIDVFRDPVFIHSI